MDKLESFCQESGSLRVQSGYVLENLKSYLMKNGGWDTPWDLGARGSCQIGGNISTCAGGINFVRYGSLRKFVTGLEVVLADGSILDLTQREANPQIDLKQNFIGSEGTLGVITKIVLQCVPRVKETRLLFLEVSSFEDILLLHDRAKDIFGSALNAIEYLDNDSYELVRAVKSQNYIFPFKKHLGKKPYHLLVEIEGSDD